MCAGCCRREREARRKAIDVVDVFCDLSIASRCVSSGLCMDMVQAE